MRTLTPHPVAEAIWKKALADYRAAHPEHEDAVCQVVDLAREEFYLHSAGHEDEARYAAEGPEAAELVLSLDCLMWQRGLIQTGHRLKVTPAEQESEIA